MRRAPGIAPSGSQDSLGQRASGALAWSVLNTAVSKLGTLAVGIALARLLGPEAFGTFAVAMVALMAVLSFNELGVSLAIVRWQGDPHLIAPTVATVSIVSSVVLFAACYAVAPTYTAAMGDPGATPVVRLMFVALLINGLVASPAALMQREFMQKQRMLVDQVNVWLGAVVSITLAMVGMGAMSLAVGRTAGSVVSAVLFIWYAPRGLRLGLDRSLLRPLLRFGLPLAGSSVIVFAAGYADQIVVGAMLTPKELGFYVLAFNLASWPVAMFSQPLRSVAPAAFARLRDDPSAMTSSLKWVIGVLAAVAFPVCFLLAGASTPIIHVVYGDQWAGSAPILAWLALLGALRILFELAYDYLVVLGKTRTIFGIQIVWLVVLVPALVGGATLSGTEGVAAAQFLVALMLVLPLYMYRIAGTGLPARAFGRRLVLPLIGGAVVWGGSVLLSAEVQHDLRACVGAGALALAVIALLLVLEGSVVHRLREFRSVQSDVDIEPLS